MNLSPHFARHEFEHGEFIPKAALPCFEGMCKEILEPIREKYGVVSIASGYRSPNHNHAVGGKPISQHIATSEFCAADLKIPGADLVEVFDWLRLQARLPIDQLILEYAEDSDHKPACIHVSYSKTPRYMALEGLTHNRSPYTARAFNAPTDVSA